MTNRVKPHVGRHIGAPARRPQLITRTAPRIHVVSIRAACARRICHVHTLSHGLEHLRQHLRLPWQDGKHGRIVDQTRLPGGRLAEARVHTTLVSAHGLPIQERLGPRARAQPGATPNIAELNLRCSAKRGRECQPTTRPSPSGQHHRCHCFPRDRTQTRRRTRRHGWHCARSTLCRHQPTSGKPWAGTRYHRHSPPRDGEHERHAHPKQPVPTATRAPTRRTT